MQPAGQLQRLLMPGTLHLPRRSLRLACLGLENTAASTWTRLLTAGCRRQALALCSTAQPEGPRRIATRLLLVRWWQGLVLSQAIVCPPPAPGCCLLSWRRALALVRLLLWQRLTWSGRCVRPRLLRGLPIFI